MRVRARESGRVVDDRGPIGPAFAAAPVMSTVEGGGRIDARPQGNKDVDWDRWPVAAYLAENYRHLHPADAAVIAHHGAYYRTLAPDSLGSSLELGAGPNLYPLMLAAAASRRIDAVERGAANLEYLTRQLRDGPDESWQAFYAECRRRQPALPPTLVQALSRVRIVPGDMLELGPGGYDLASMNFVAESVTEDEAEFERLCRAFIDSTRPGGHLVAAFMENMARYRLGDGSTWPGFPVGPEQIRRVFDPHTEDLTIVRIDADPSLPEYGYTGMVLLTARRKGVGRAQPRRPGGRRVMFGEMTVAAGSGSQSQDPRREAT